jgi:hypothetical protein
VEASMDTPWAVQGQEGGMHRGNRTEDLYIFIFVSNELGACRHWYAARNTREYSIVWAA